MSDPKKVALFVDVENVYLGLRNIYNRELGPELLVEKAKVRGELVKAIAYADWKELPEGLADKFKPFGFETVQVDRVVHSRELGGKRREVVKDMVPVEMLAGVVATLLENTEIGTVVLASGDRSLAPAARVAREKLSRDVIVCAIPGSVAKELETGATAMDLIEVPPLEPVDEVGLSKLVPLMEELERRKRYLNFKYIRESVVRHGELKAKTFDEAERLLSDAIACGLVLKQKVEDKYHPGQLFTAYALNRDSALWRKYGNGLPAPVRLEGEDGDIREGAGVPDGTSLEGGVPALSASGVAPDEPSRSDAAPGDVSELAAVLGSSGTGPAPAIPMFTASSERADRGDARPEGRGDGRGERGEGRGEGEGRERRGRRGRRGRGDRGGDRPERGGEAARPGGERLEPARAASTGTDRPERSDRGEARGDRPERSDRGEARSDRPERSDRGERSDRSDGRGDRGERSDRSDGRGDRGGDRGRDRDRGGDRDRGRRGERGRSQPARSGAAPADKRGRGPRDGARTGGRDPVRRFDAPARVREPITPVLNDDEVDEERILGARGDLGGRGLE